VTFNSHSESITSTGWVILSLSTGSKQCILLMLMTTASRNSKEIENQARAGRAWNTDATTELCRGHGFVLRWMQTFRLILHHYFFCNYAPSDVNIAIDGCTYPGWKRLTYGQLRKQFWVESNAASYYLGSVSPSAADEAPLAYYSAFLSRWYVDREHDLKL